MKNGSRLIIIGLILLYVVMRIILLQAPRVYSGLPMRTTPDPEELVSGTIGWEILKGPILSPFWMYTNPPRDGGVPLVGLISVPFLALLGPTYFTLKFVGMLIFAASLGIMLMFLADNFSTRVAVMAGLLYVFSSPFNIFYEFFVDGRYSQAFLLCSIVIFFLYKVAFPSRGSYRKLNASILGILCGVALYWHPYLLSVVFFCGLILLLYRREIFLSAECFFLAGFFLLSLAPSLPAYVFLEKHGVTHFPGRAAFLSADYFKNIWIKLRLLLSHDCAMMSYFDQILPRGGKYLNWAYWLFSLISFISLGLLSMKKPFGAPRVKGYPAKKVHAFLFFPPIVAMLYLASNMANHTTENRYRFLIFLYLSFPVLIALFVDQCLRQLPRPGRTCCAAALAFFVGIGAFSQILLSLPGEENLKQTSVKAYGEIGGTVLYRYGNRVTEGLRATWSKRAGMERHDAMRGYLMRLLADLIVTRHLTPEDLDAYSEGLDREFHPCYFRQLGRTLAYFTNFDYPALRTAFKGISEPRREYCYEGLGMAMADSLLGRPDAPTLARHVRSFNRDMTQIATQYRPACYRGLGAVAAWDYKPLGEYTMRMGKDMTRFHSVLQLVPPHYRDECLAGSEITYFLFPNY